LASDLTAAETVDASSLTSFDTGGFSLGTNINYNTSAEAFVAWQWQAGQGSTSSNTNGTITSTVSVNASAGFSVVTYTGTGSAATVGHGLGVAPSMVIVKGRTNVSDWRVYHASVTLPNVLNLNNTTAASSDPAAFGSTAPTSSVFTLGTGAGTNSNTNNYVAYCWTPIAGFSAFGSYTGNGSTDGPFVYTGFRPKFILWKRTDTVAEWILQDTSRQTFNAAPNNAFNLTPDSSVIENDSGILAGPTNANNIDWLSNGFKIRFNNNNCNASGSTYIYMAFAENPFKNALAR
jgi:hypothetical protein